MEAPLKAAQHGDCLALTVGSSSIVGEMANYGGIPTDLNPCTGINGLQILEGLNDFNTCGSLDSYDTWELLQPVSTNDFDTWELLSPESPLY
jgi:hypothetical protein